MKSIGMIRTVLCVWFLSLVIVQSGESTERIKNGIDWENGVIYATATAGVDMDAMTSIGQAEQEARTQAYDMACVQLNKIINGLSINSQRIYERSATQDHILRTQTEGMIYNARVLEEKIKWIKFKGRDEPKAEMTVFVDLRTREEKRGDDVHKIYGLAKPIVEYEARLAKTEPQLPLFSLKEPEGTQEAYTGLIIDAGATDLDPVCNPKILTSKGTRELYGVRSVDIHRLGEQFIAHYTDSVEKARQSSRAGSNPLIVKATGIKGSRKGDVVVSEDDAKKILSADVGTEFLSKCNVVMVVKKIQ
jgi:hypothetical protein